MTSDLRVGIVGAGLMGADHVARITNRISGAVISAVIEPDAARAEAAVATAPGAQAFARIEDALEAGALDAAIIATPGRFHEPVLLAALEAKLPVLCEKPLTPGSESSAKVLELEQKLDKPHIQVGFMRRFDREYAELRGLVDSRDAGELLILHCAHRNPIAPANGYTQDMLINDSVVHEFDIVPWVAGSPIVSVDVRYGRRNSLSPEHLREPIVVLMELENGVLAEVEMNVSAQFGYQVATEAVFEQGIARIGQPRGMQLWKGGRMAVGEHTAFATRFADAFDAEVQCWVDAVRDGRLVDGPNAWDGYRVALACEAGVTALHTGVRTEVPNSPRPAFYGG
ncbi:Gfo/Idh/MocA family protein [Tessaracoccus caeni]|uniref:Gfo/Idh/MocA family protein n=1 Tax=Tessaracoccus caeni TaxID=3031239 RepID=UPI0023DA095E|nr:Gfo/Idh/MocA family oxidoreductase [Tessaracoccus caeni]MDF1488063.1 Gfo/Idh/MocA family oxidoreductase [Tessaracoccus caeni]